MFSSNPNYTKLKTHLRLAINRLKLLEKKKTELTQKARKEIAEYIAAGKSERAKIRVEHIIRSVFPLFIHKIKYSNYALVGITFQLNHHLKDDSSSDCVHNTRKTRTRTAFFPKCRYMSLSFLY